MQPTLDAILRDLHALALSARDAMIFEAEYKRLANSPDYKSMFSEVDLSAVASEVHNGYFSIDKKEVGGKTVEMLKDTSGTTAADDDTYNLIM